MLWPEGEHLLFKSGVPSLADLCLDYVADCFQQLEGLGTWLPRLASLYICWAWGPLLTHMFGVRLNAYRPTTGDGAATSVCEAESVTKDKRHDPLALPHRQQQRVAPMNFFFLLPALLMDRGACDIHTHTRTRTHAHVQSMPLCRVRLLLDEVGVREHGHTAVQSLHAAASQLVQLYTNHRRSVRSRWPVRLFPPFPSHNLTAGCFVCARRVQAITKESRILETLIVSNNPNIMDPIKYGPDCVFVLEGGRLCETKNDLCVNTGTSVRACWPLTFDPPSSRMKRCALSPGTTRFRYHERIARVYQFC